MSRLVAEARNFASLKHAGQEYAPGVPYTVHLDAVAKEVAPCGPQAQVVAYLHDVLEDTAVKRMDLRHRFGGDVEHKVGICTDEPGENRRARKAKTNIKLAAVDPPWVDTLVVKVADRLCNIRAAALHRPGLLDMYRREHAAFERAARRPGWADPWWAEMAALLAEPPAPIVSDVAFPEEP